MGIVDLFINRKTKKSNKQIPSRQEIDPSYLTYRKETGFPNEYIVFDFETTGLDPWNDAIIQMSAIHFRDEEIIEEISHFVNPLRLIPKNITRITGIKDKDVKSAPSIDQILPRLVDFIDNYTLVAHNASFDMRFLLAKLYQQNIDKITNTVIDTLTLSRKHIKNVDNYKLETLKIFMGLNVGSHNSYDDCLTCGKVYRFCKQNHESFHQATKKKDKSLKLFHNFHNWGEQVKEILFINGKDTEIIRFGIIGEKYFDVRAFYTIVRVKLTGNKKYLLSNLTKQEILNHIPTALCEDTVKSETGKTRILINKPEDLWEYQFLIVQAYDEALNSLESYRKNVNVAEKNFQNYMNS